MPFSVEFRYNGEVIKTGTVVSAEGQTEATLPPDALPDDSVIADSDPQSTVQFLGWKTGDNPIIYTNREDLLAAEGYADIGAFVVSGDVIFDAVVESGAIGALNEEGAQDDSDGDGTSVIAGTGPQSTMTDEASAGDIEAPGMTIGALGSDIEALDAGSITSASIEVLYDGEGWFDAVAGAGNDTANNNKIVRNNDFITYKLNYVLGTAGEIITAAVLPVGMEWDSSALTEAKSGSSISPDGQTLTVVRDINGSGNLELKARVYNHNQGDKVKIASATIGGVAVTGLDTAEVTVSAAPNYRITTGDTNGRLINNGPNQDASNNFSTQIGARIGYSFGLYAVIDPNKGVKGIAPLGSCTFEVTTSVPTAVYSFSASGTASMNSFPLINSGTQSYLEKGLVNKHTITYSGFDTSFRSARPATTYVGSAVPDFAHYIKVVRVDFWTPASSLSTTSGTANTMTLLSTTTGMNSGTPGLTSYASGGIRNTNNYAFPRLDNVVRQENYISSISGRAFDLHKGETCTFTVPTAPGGGMTTPHTGLEIIASWDEDIAVFDPRANVSGQTINGVVYTVSYGHLDNPSDPSTLVGAWSTTKPGVDSNINAVRLTTNDPTATFPAGEGCTLLIPLVVKSDAPITNMNHYSFYTSEQQALTSLAESTNINPAGIDVDLAWQNEFSGSNVQTPGTVQVLKMTPWVAGNNAGTYSSRDYRTPTTGTAQDLQVVVTIPNAAHFLVDEVALAAELSKTYPGLGASAASAVVGGSRVLTFTFASAVTHNGALPTLNIPVSATIGTTTGTYDATAVISSPSDNLNENLRQDTARISFNQLNEFAMQKTVSTRFAQPGSEVTWTLRYVNFSTDAATGVVLVDVLPYNGDARGTTGLGAPLTITNVNADSVGVEYTTDASAGVVTALEADPTGGTGITWVSGAPTASAGATALRFTVGNVAVKGEGSVSFTTRIDTFDFGSSLNNNAYGTADSLSPFTPAAPPVASSASVIEGKVYKDSDFSGDYTGTLLDDLQRNVIVTLTTADTALQALLNTLFGDYPLTRTTTLLGEYHFENLPEGNYTVSVPNEPHFKFIEPAVGTNTYDVTLGANDAVTRDFGLQATRWNIQYHVNLPSDASQPTPAITLPAVNANPISTANDSAPTGSPIGLPVKANGTYVFDGWAASADGPVVYAATAPVLKQPADTTVNLYAHWTWTRSTHQLSYVLNGTPDAPTTPASIPAETYGTGLAIANANGFVASPTRTGHTFGGWYLDSALTKTLTSAPNMPDSNATIYARWTANLYPYTVTHHFVGGPNSGTFTLALSGTALFGQPFTAPATTVYTGYTHNAAHPSAVPSGTVGAGGLALHLYYEAIPYIITFDANGGELNTGGNILFYPVDYGTLWSASGITVPTATLSGYTFIGWSPVIPDGSTAITANATYTAQWTYNPPPPPPTPPTPPPVNPPPVVPPVVVVDTEPDPDPVPPPAPIEPPDPNTTVTTEVEPQVPDAPAPEIILNDQARLDAQTGNIFSDLANGNVPLGSFFGSGAWSLLSLILSLIAVIVALLLLVGAAAKRRERKDEDTVRYEDAETEKKEERRKYTMALRIMTIVIGFLTMIVWLILDDLSLPMVWVNKWTLFVAVVFLVHIIFLAVYRYNKAKDEKEDGDDEANGSQPMTA